MHERREPLVVVVSGPGGVGKTRLMIAVAAALGRDGWTAGFLDSAHDRTDAALKQREQALDQLGIPGEQVHSERFAMA